MKPNAGRTTNLILTCWLLGMILISAGVLRADKLYDVRPVEDVTPADPNTVRHRCLTPNGNPHDLGTAIADFKARTGQAQGAEFDTTIHCLVLRFDFQYEETDDPNTTGRGHMDMSRPLDTLSDEEYIDRVGHLTDPPPHDSAYFDAHLQALNSYWETVSGGQVHLTWDIYPPEPTAVYELPHPMSYYGKCDFRDVVAGLENYFVDGISLADSVSPEIDFSAYDAYFLFHAGADAQNDLGFPQTCSDLFSGYIRFGGEVPVDDSTFFVTDGLMMPETAVQDNRATALNAVMAHEFGHQLGLVDLYSTFNFFSQLGDFALMDNNGFGTGIDFGWPVGRVFGAIPLYPCAWSRAFLGFEDVVDLRHDTTGVEILAAELPEEPGSRVVRIPITEGEFYLIENRSEDVDGHTTFVLADQETSVIQGPVDSTRTPTGEYDFLMPGSGLAIYHVDEAVAGLDYDGDGVNNFDDNDLQWFVDERKFIRLVEADGLVQFGGNYRSGYGRPEDLFRDDRQTSFTPNSNPATVDNSGNQTHIYVENIGRVLMTPSGPRDDTRIRFDFDIERVAEGFPVRAGRPSIGLSPIVDDVDGDGLEEVIVASGMNLIGVTSSGENYMLTQVNCPGCPIIYDTAVSSINTGSATNPAALYPLPLMARTAQTITAGPVTGRFDPARPDKYVVVGHPFDNASGRISIFEVADGNGDGLADAVGLPFSTDGFPIGLSFADSSLFIVTDSGKVYRQTTPGPLADLLAEIDMNQNRINGFCRLGDNLIVLVESLMEPGPMTRLAFIGASAAEYTLDDLYIYGPIVVDLDRNGSPEIVMFGPGGHGAYVTVDTTGGGASFSLMEERATGYEVTTNPVAADLDLDGYPEVVVGGANALLAFNRELTLKTNYPQEVDDRYPGVDVIASPIVADIESGGQPETIFPTAVGNFYAFGTQLSYGFPVTSGEQFQNFTGSPAVYFGDATTGKIGYLGGDGWFYAWATDPAGQRTFWRMNGADPSGSFVFDQNSLPAVQAGPTGFDEDKYYNYPNPVLDGHTYLRYFLGEQAETVTLDIYDLSGVRVASLDGPTSGGIDNEVGWDCADVGAGVYRCVINVDAGGQTYTAFTDIAVIN